MLCDTKMWKLTRLKMGFQHRDLKHEYAGIGLRSTRQTVLDVMTQVAMKLRKEGWVLRSRAAPGGGFSL